MHIAFTITPAYDSRCQYALRLTARRDKLLEIVDRCSIPVNCRFRYQVYQKPTPTGALSVPV